jgi:hypothetical protein
MNARDRLQAGRAATHAGQFEDALAHFVWFHEHALQEDPAYRGVRLSFALSYWLELAEQYPPAMAEYQARLNDKIDRLLGGTLSRSLFHDIEAMNESLNADERTAEVFAALDATQSEFAQSCARIAVPALVRVKRYALAAKYVPEPEAQVLAKASELVRDVAEIETRPRTRAPRYRAFLQIYAEDLQQMEELLKSTGREGRAKQLRSEALSTLKPVYLRNAVARLLAAEA